MSQFKDIEELEEVFQEHYYRHHAAAARYCTSFGCPNWISLDLHAAKLKLLGVFSVAEQLQAKEHISEKRQQEILNFPHQPGDREYASIDGKVRCAIRVMFAHGLPVLIVRHDAGSDFEVLQQETPSEGG